MYNIFLHWPLIYCSSVSSELGEISSVGVLPMPPPPPPPSLPLCPPILIEQERAAIIPTASSSTLFPESAPQLVQAAIVPPPPDLQPIVDKLANYVARNGEDFESTVKAKNDARFEFLNPWNAHYSYYQYKKQLCQQQLKKKSSSAGASGIHGQLLCFLLLFTCCEWLE